MSFFPCFPTLFNSVYSQHRPSFLLCNRSLTRGPSVSPFADLVERVCNLTKLRKELLQRYGQAEGATHYGPSGTPSDNGLSFPYLPSLPVPPTLPSQAVPGTFYQSAYPGLQSHLPSGAAYGPFQGMGDHPEADFNGSFPMVANQQTSFAAQTATDGQTVNRPDSSLSVSSNATVIIGCPSESGLPQSD